MSTVRRAIIAIIALSIAIIVALPPVRVYAQDPQVYEVGVPVCTISWYPTYSVPAGWLDLSNYNSISVGVYPELFDCVGYTYGGVAGESYELPYLRGKFIMGYATNYTLGATGGEISHTLSIAEIPSHAHPPANGYSYFWGVTGAANNIGSGSTFRGDWMPGTGNTGGGQKHNTLPPYIALVPAIKAVPTYITVTQTTNYFTTTQYFTVTLIYTGTPESGSGICPDFPSTGILDDFNRANEGPPPYVDWSNDLNPDDEGLEVNANQLALESGGVQGLAWWNDIIGPDIDIYVDIPIRQTDGKTIALFGRFDSKTENGSGYVLAYSREDVGTDQFFLVRYDAGSDVVLDTFEQDIDDGASIGLRILGTTLTAYYKPSGGAWTELGSVVDGTYTEAGYVGVQIDGEVARLDNFGGGNAACTSTIMPTPDAYTSTLPSGKTLYIPILFSFGEIVMATLALGVCAVLGYSFLFGMVYHK